MYLQRSRPGCIRLAWPWMPPLPVQGRRYPDVSRFNAPPALAPPVSVQFIAGQRHELNHHLVNPHFWRGIARPTKLPGDARPQWQLLLQATALPGQLAAASPPRARLCRWGEGGAPGPANGAAGGETAKVRGQGLCERAPQPQLSAARPACAHTHTHARTLSRRHMSSRGGVTRPTA